MASRKVSTAGFLNISGKYYTNAPEIDDLVETVFPTIRKIYKKSIEREKLVTLLEETLKNYETLPSIEKISEEIVKKLKNNLEFSK